MGGGMLQLAFPEKVRGSTHVAVHAHKQEALLMMPLALGASAIFCEWLVFFASRKCGPLKADGSLHGTTVFADGHPLYLVVNPSAFPHMHVRRIRRGTAMRRRFDGC